MDTNTTYNVKNRSAGMVVYSIPEEGIRREFQPGETKKIRHGELEKLSYQSGGRELMANYLIISNEEAIADLGMGTEPEYYLNEQQIVDLIKTGSMDAWLDCIDFAPAGVIDLLKQLSVSTPLNDIQKMKALKEKTGFDVETALKNVESSEKEIPQVVERRVKETKKEEVPEGRRTTPKYNVVNK